MSNISAVSTSEPGWPDKVTGLAYGGDYNPEQWPEQTRLEDLELMRESRVNLVSVAIFSWAMLEPREGQYDWAWLDQTMDRLEAAGVKVALATATASPPPWLTHQHPEILPETLDGTVLHPGSRQHYAVSNPIFREYALRMTRAIAQRYAQHPALALWHVDNELGCHNALDYSSDAANAFCSWLRQRYGTVEELNRAWGTAFWSQRYSEFEEILPPRAAPMFSNPTQKLDFHRYSSDELLQYFREMKSILRELTPDVPVTTNFMCTTRSKNMNYFDWASEMDVIATDHYTIADDPERHIELAFSADLTRGVAGGKPWMLMEHSTSAVNWQPCNHSKTGKEMLRNSIGHVARGADAVMFFQWRQSAVGAEKYHSAMVPHAGTDSDVYRSTVSLGETLSKLAISQGSTVSAEVALLFDYEAWWGSELDSHPHNGLVYPDEVMRWYRELWKAGVTVDIVHPSQDLNVYRAVIVPSLYLITDEHAAGIATAAKNGTQVLISYFSGIVDENDHVRLGGYPGAFRELLGIRSEEIWPLQADQRILLDDGQEAEFWSEKITPVDSGSGLAEVITRFDQGPLKGRPAVTRNAVGAGAAWYVGTRLTAAGTRALVEEVLKDAGLDGGVQDVLEASDAEEIEMVARHSEAGTFRFIMNHTEQPARVRACGTELLSGLSVSEEVLIPAGDIAVVHSV